MSATQVLLPGCAAELPTSYDRSQAREGKSRFQSRASAGSSWTIDVQTAVVQLGAFTS